MNGAERGHECAVGVAFVLKAVEHFNDSYDGENSCVCCDTQAVKCAQDFIRCVLFRHEGAAVLDGEEFW